VIGGSAGIGLETARRARAEGANIILTGRNPSRLERAAAELGARRPSTLVQNSVAARDRVLANMWRNSTASRIFADQHKILSPQGFHRLSQLGLRVAIGARGE
jgi:NAD(P)-dependent dehydrogenase (short-subunit alcohol dehydrogenase family)